VASVVSRALAKDPSARFQSASELSRAFEAACQSPSSRTSMTPRKARRWFLALGAMVLMTGGAWIAVKLRPLVAVEPAAQAVDIAAVPPQLAAAQLPPAEPQGPAPIKSSRQRERRPRASPPIAASSAAGAPAKLRVVTTQGGEPTWATLLVNGRLLGTTPMAMDLPPGKHQIQVEREGFKSVYKRVDLSSGGTEIVRIELSR
jgi:hypothetical protein